MRVNFKPIGLQLLGRRENEELYPTETEHLGRTSPVKTEQSKRARTEALAASQATRPVLMLKNKTILSHPEEVPTRHSGKTPSKNFLFCCLNM